MWIAKLLSFLSKILFGNKGKTHTIILCEKRLKDRENGKKLYVLITVDMESYFHDLNLNKNLFNNEFECTSIMDICDMFDLKCTFF